MTTANSIWQRSDVLSAYSAELNYSEILKLRAQAESILCREFWQPLRKLLTQLPLGDELASAFEIDCAAAVVRVGSRADLSSTQAEALEAAIAKLCPWRKGPFELFGTFIDTEWQSNKKWDRIAANLPDLKGKRVADVGCGNGYYMLRASAHAPEMLVGFDPSEYFYYQFELLQRFVQRANIRYEPYGSDGLANFGRFFDVALCLGIVYHTRSPLEQLKLIFESLRPGGEVIVESQTIPGDESVCLFTPGRYGKSRNVYFIPTAVCLQSWLERTGFVDIELFSHIALTTDEQRQTKFAPFESLKDFLDPADPSKTVEGYPAPYRSCVRARRRSA